MDRPDTLLELHRSVVEEIAAADFPATAYDPEPFQTPFVEGEARLSLGLSRVWFYEDASGRVWGEVAGTPDADRERHFAIDLGLVDHPSGIPDSRLVITKLLGLPAPTVPSTTCRGQTVPANVIPLPGRLTIHEHLDRIASTVGGTPAQNIVVEFGAQPAPAMTSTPPRAGVDARLFGPGVQRAAGGRVTLTGGDPRIVWELTREEQRCVVESTAGRALVLQETLGGATPTEAENAVLDMIAAKLAEGVAGKLLESGDAMTSVKSILPNPDALPPDQVGITVGAECAAGATAIEIDARVKRFTRPESGDSAESLVFQMRTVEGLPDPDRLPDSVLALRERERVGFSRAGWAIRRSIRCSQIKALCLQASDFDPAEACRLDHRVGIVIGDSEGTLESFEASIVPWAGHPGLGLLRIGGSAEGGTWAYDWSMEFELDFRLDRGEVPRDPRTGEPQERRGTLAEIAGRVDALYAERCAGTRPREDIDAELEALAAEKKLPPQTIGVKPIDERVFENSHSSVTWEGALAGIALVAALTILSGGAGLGFSGGVIFSFFVLGVALGSAAVSALDAWVLDAKVSEQVEAFVNDKRDQSGDAIPLDGFEPILVELRRTDASPDAYALNAFLEEIAPRMRVQWREPDSPKPAGDPDYVSQWFAGRLPGEDRIWMLTVADAARYITTGRLALTVGDPASPDGEADVHVATSRRGRRYLRTDPDAGPANNLARLPPLPD
jgi:hypothetical protein